MKKMSIVLILIIVVVPNMFAQDINNAYNVWGFRAPFLKSGEFIASVTGNYSSYEQNYRNDNRPDYFSDYESNSKYAYARGILAITDKFLVNSTLYFYPKNDNSSNKYGDTGYDNKSTSKQKAYLYPQLSLIYRPVNNLEFSGSVYGYNRESSTKTVYSNPDSNPDFNRSDNRSFGGNISINYFGKLWNK